jgi:hypothetical protein
LYNGLISQLSLTGIAGKRRFELLLRRKAMHDDYLDVNPLFLNKINKTGLTGLGSICSGLKSSGSLFYGVTKHG